MAAILPEHRQSALAKARYFQRRELDLGMKIRRLYEDLLFPWREDLERVFFKAVVVPVGAEGAPRWEPVKARQEAIPAAEQKYVEVDHALRVASETLLEEELVETFKDGYLWGVWEMVAAGVIDEAEAELLQDELLDGTEVEDLTIPRPPDDEAINQMLLVVGFGGLAYLDRMARWRQIYEAKLRRWLDASAAGGLTFIDTTEGVDRILDGLRARLVSLGQNEAHRAFTRGNTVAWRAVAPDRIVGEVWMTREDPLVCVTCQAKHLTVTEDQPILDSHPSCRCVKVPIVLDADGQPVDWEAFLRRVGKR